MERSKHCLFTKRIHASTQTETSPRSCIYYPSTRQKLAQCIDRILQCHPIRTNATSNVGRQLVQVTLWIVPSNLNRFVHHLRPTQQTRKLPRSAPEQANHLETPQGRNVVETRKERHQPSPLEAHQRGQHLQHPPNLRPDKQAIAARQENLARHQEPTTTTTKKITDHTGTQSDWLIVPESTTHKQKNQ